MYAGRTYPLAIAHLVSLPLCDPTAAPMTWVSGTVAELKLRRIFLAFLPGSTSLLQAVALNLGPWPACRGCLSQSATSTAEHQGGHRRSAPAFWPFTCKWSSQPGLAHPLSLPRKIWKRECLGNRAQPCTQAALPSAHAPAGFLTDALATQPGFPPDPEFGLILWVSNLILV